MKKKRERLKTVLILKWYSICLSIGSIGYGVYLQSYPFTVNRQTSYMVITNILSSKWASLAFIALGMIKLVFIYLNYKPGKLVALSGLIFMWTLFTVGFFLQHYNGYPNAGWIITGIIVLQALGISQRGDFRK